MLPSWGNFEIFTKFFSFSKLSKQLDQINSSCDNSLQISVSLITQVFEDGQCILSELKHEIVLPYACKSSNLSIANYARDKKE